MRAGAECKAHSQLGVVSARSPLHRQSGPQPVLLAAPSSAFISYGRLMDLAAGDKWQIIEAECLFRFAQAKRKFWLWMFLLYNCDFYKP
jgi:hypothetical protein